MNPWLIGLAIWLAVACIAGPFIGRCIKAGRGPRNGDQQ